MLVSTVSQLTSSWAAGYAAAGLETHAACEQSTGSLLPAHVNKSSNTAALTNFIMTHSSLALFM